MPEFSRKIVAFVDVLGFKAMVAEAETGDHGRLDELLKLLNLLGDGSERATFEKYGPLCCPQSPCLSRDLDFQVTQISDCVIISAELSPAGAINLVNHCWKVAIRLLQIGVLCRGFITIGNIYHERNQVIGTGYQNAFRGESIVDAFKREANEIGTPYIQVANELSEFIDQQSNECVKEMFHRMTKFDGEKYAIFPFKRLDHEFIIGGISGPFDPDKHLRSVDNIRGWIADILKKIADSQRDASESAIRKSQHYVSALQDQLRALDETEQFIRSIPKGLL